ncbi:MAG: ARPP-1 family domain-containing protein [Planctomycetota bacterium]|jgi:hypothetical protein
MQDLLINYLEQLRIGQKQSYKNLAVYSLLSEYVVTLDYLTLDEAMSQDAIDVVEIDKGGSVPELKVINKSGKMILILDGEELVGAKQNRIVNTTILVAANATTVIPVSCVEQGRWAYTSNKFVSEQRRMAPEMRAALAADVSFSLKRDRGYRSNQSALWDRISAKADRLDAMSDSMEMATIYRKETPAIKEYVEKFELVDHQIGAVFLINGKVVGMDCFGKAETFSKTYKKLTESYALDAIDMAETEKKYKVSGKDAEKLLKTAANGRVESHASVGLGTDCRLESKSLTGFALAHKDQILHFSVFARADAGDKGEKHSPMAKASLRRRYRR